MDTKNYDTLKEGSVLEEFKEVKEVNEIISSLSNIIGDSIAVEMAVEKFQFIIDQYQEQPHLLDPHLESLLSQLLGIARNSNTSMDAIHLAFKLLYLITKTRGYKVIVRLMPHEVADVEPLLSLLKQQSPTDYQTWETRYMLLLWLSIVCMIPFDMCRLDSNVAGNGDAKETKKPIMDRIIEAGKIYLDATDKSRDAAAYMLSKFMTRPDVKKEKLPKFLDWALVFLRKIDGSTTIGMMKISGILSVLALLFKHGKREDLVEYAPVILEQISPMNLKESNNTLLRKISIKLIQRIGLIFLKARVAAWRYQRGSRSLTDNLQTNKQTQISQTTMQTEEEEEEYDIPDEMEEIIELLLMNLKDKDTIVRWSAAKGIGRITNRLPQELADDVVASLMELFTITETDGAWHGGCLALAELGRRGLLLPHRLSDVVPVIIRALNYDQRRGFFSVGSHVRDAACYVCWAFARAYEPEELKLYVNEIATALVIVSIFDREVNVRRAAAAAFQENVGRQGQFPHGIDILTTCDYFAVGNRKTCYHELSVFIAQYEEYTKALVDHLVQEKMEHWDMAMRELTSQGLHNLVPCYPKYFIEKVLPTVISKSTSMDLSLRHGAILSTGEIVHALAKYAWADGKKIEDVIDQKTLNGIRDITLKLQNAQLFRGIGGDMMRQAICSLMNKVASAKCPFLNDEIIAVWREMIEECLTNVDQEVQSKAVNAIPAFFEAYHKGKNGKTDVQDGLSMQDELLEKYIRHFSSSTESTRMGYLSAMGSMPVSVIKGQVKPVLLALTGACTLTKKDEKMAEARRDAIKAITSICEKIDIDLSVDADPSQVLCETNISLVYKALFSAMNDYTLDSRGDVGAWVREAAMSGLYAITSRLVKSGYKFQDTDMIRILVCALVQQALEKIDRTRALAGELFSQLLYHEPEIPAVDHREELKKIFSMESLIAALGDGKSISQDDLPSVTDIRKINWAVPSHTFPLFTQLLSYDTYAYNVMLGLTVSVGGLTESLVKFSVASMFTYLRYVASDRGKLDKFSAILLRVCKDHQKVDRITIPMFKMLDQLMARDIFALYAEDDHHSFPMEILNFSKNEITKCGDPNKLITSINVFCGVLQFPGDVRKKTLLQLMIFLCHRFPLIRKTTANKLYETIVTYDDIVDDKSLDEVMNLLSDTQWDHEIAEVKPIRNRLCDLVGVPQPKVIKKQAPAADKS